MTDLLTPEQVAEILRKSRGWVVAASRGGGLPHRRIGRDYRYVEAEIHAWIAERASYHAPDGEAEGTGERSGISVPGARPKASVGRVHRRRVVPRRSPNPSGPLRIVEAGG